MSCQCPRVVIKRVLNFRFPYGPIKGTLGKVNVFRSLSSARGYIYHPLILTHHTDHMAYYRTVIDY